MFDPNSVYLPTKKIGKNNSKAAEIEADNAARQDWNRPVDMALVSEIAEIKIIEIKNEISTTRPADPYRSTADCLGCSGVSSKRPKKSYRY